MFIYNSQAKYCVGQGACGNPQYYPCKNNRCCKNEDLGCGSFESWGCCNGPCITATGKCP